MALRLRRDVQKASYYVWFLGAEEAKGLRGERVINSALPYLINRSHSQEPLKVTLQVSHKGIKIIQGTSKHFIPHSAITSSIQVDDIVACILLLYNPVTKCPLHIHGYRCDSEATAGALHHQLQVLINRQENQKRFEEIERRLGVGSQDNSLHSKQSHSDHMISKSREFTSQLDNRFGASLSKESDIGTHKESDLSEDQASSISNSPPTMKSSSQNELFDSLAAELRAKLKGNGPPILLPPRDYDTVHRSKGNLAAIELRRCRNSLIVGASTQGSSSPPTVTAIAKQISSRGSSGIGSDMAPSPERQDLNSSSDEDHWSHDADSSVIAIKPSQIHLEQSILMNRKIENAKDNYLRDLPTKPYTPYQPSKTNTNTKNVKSQEDAIKPIIMRPIDYGAKFHQLLQSEYKELNSRNNDRDIAKSKQAGASKYNENQDIKHSMSRELINENSNMPENIEHERGNAPLPEQKGTKYAHRDNLTDMQKFIAHNSRNELQLNSRENSKKNSARQRYGDRTDIPFEEKSYTRGISMENQASYLSDKLQINQYNKNIQSNVEAPQRITSGQKSTYPIKSRNPYRESESKPYIESMEKMIKSSVIQYESYPNDQHLSMHPFERNTVQPKSDMLVVSQPKIHRMKEHEYYDEHESFHQKVKNEKLSKSSRENLQSIDQFQNYREKSKKSNFNHINIPPKSSKRMIGIPTNENWSDEDLMLHAHPEYSINKCNDEILMDRERPSHHRQNSRNETSLQNYSNTDHHAIRNFSREAYDDYSNHNSPYLEDNHFGRLHRVHSHTEERQSNYEKYPDHIAKRLPSNHKTNQCESYGINNDLLINQVVSTRAQRHSYAEPVLARTGGRVGLAAVIPF